MPDIGATLRDTRTHLGIDIAEIEAQTKIRAKYLIALENEQWDLLPGSAYVKSFLRTYAEALGLDSKLLVEEYKRRHERPAEAELQPIVPPRQEQPRERRTLPREWAIGFAVVGLLAALFVLGNLGDGGGDGTTVSGEPVEKPTTTPRRAAPPPPNKEAKSPFVRLRLEPTGLVYVCLEAAGNRRLVPGVILQPDQEQPTYRSREFRITLGNSNAQLRINGQLRTVPPVANGIGYVITRNGRRVLAPDKRPTCT
jgi:cytoskeleton protein RodZ